MNETSTTCNKNANWLGMPGVSAQPPSVIYFTYILDIYLFCVGLIMTLKYIGFSTDIRYYKKDNIYYFANRSFFLSTWRRDATASLDVYLVSRYIEIFSRISANIYPT